MMMEVGEDGIVIIHDVSNSLSQTLSCTVLLETFILWNWRCFLLYAHPTTVHRACMRKRGTSTLWDI